VVFLLFNRIIPKHIGNPGMVLMCENSKDQKFGCLPSLRAYAHRVAVESATVGQEAARRGDQYFRYWGVGGMGEKTKHSIRINLSINQWIATKKLHRSKEVN